MWGKDKASPQRCYKIFKLAARAKKTFQFCQILNLLKFLAPHALKLPTKTVQLRTHNTMHCIAPVQKKNKTHSVPCFDRECVLVYETVNNLFFPLLTDLIFHWENPNSCSNGNLCATNRFFLKNVFNFLILSITFFSWTSLYFMLQIGFEYANNVPNFEWPFVIVYKRKKVERKFEKKIV